MRSFKVSKLTPGYAFVKFTDEKSIEGTTSSKDGIIGVSDTINAEVGEVCDVFTNGDFAEIEAGGTFEAGDPLTSDSTGKAVLAKAGDNIGAIAFQDAVAGDIVKAQVIITRSIQESEG